MKNKKLLINIFISLFFAFYFIFNVFLIPHYGMSWDEQVHYQRAQVYLQYFLTGDGSTFTKNDRLSIYQNFQVGKDWMDFSYWMRNDAGHPPLNGILASAFNRLFYQNLGVLGDIESYHLFVVLVSVSLVALVFFWTKKAYGIFAGVVAFLSISLYPLFFAESHFNIKDPVEASFYVATLLFFYNGITKNSWKWIMGSSLFAGLALGTKFNILFAIFTILPWLVIYKWQYLRNVILNKVKDLDSSPASRRGQNDKEHVSKKLIIACLISPLIAFGILYATWPLLWQSPIDNLLKILTYYKEIGSGIFYQPAEYLLFGKINTFALQWIFFTTPLVILFLSILGIIYVFTKGFQEKNKTSLLILFWFLIPVIRVTLPGTSIYGGVRQIMEYIPAMAILSGIGAKCMVTWLHGYIVKYKPFSHLTIRPLQLLVILSFLPITFKLISIHPNENVYFNPLIGELKGAKEKNIMYWGYNLGNVFRQGVLWLNQNAETNAKVARGTAYEDSIPKIWFRSDINYSNDYQSGFEKKGEYIIELTNDMLVWSHYYYYNYARNTLKPLYEIKVDNTAILTIWKNDWEHTKDEFKKEEETIGVNNVKKDKNYILIDLEQELLLTELNIVFSNSSCHFTKDGYFVTADSKDNWTNHPGDLEEVAFYNNFNPRLNKDVLSYLFPGIKTRFIKVIFAENNDCFENIKEVKVKKI